MRPLGRSAAPALAACLIAAGGASAEVYRWTDAAGGEHYAGELSQVPAEHRAAAEAAAASAPEPSRLQTFESRAAPRTRRSSAGLFHVPYEQRGNAMLVHVRLNDRVTAPFLIDTGAADVVVPAAVAARAGIEIGPETPRETYATANGLVRQAVVRIDAVEAGEARVEGVRGSVSESLPLGLLGTSYLHHFTLQIDPAARLLTLLPNPAMRGGAGQDEWSERFRRLRERQERLDAHLSRGVLADDERVRELEASRERLEAELEALEREADRAEVPAAWRE